MSNRIGIDDPSAAVSQPAPVGLRARENAPFSTVEFNPTDNALWLMVDDAFSSVREHEFESLFAVSNGYLGRRGSIPMGIPAATSTIFVAGVFEAIAPSPALELVSLPGWALLSQSLGAEPVASDAQRGGLDIEASGVAILQHRRLLDMRQGMFRRLFRFSDRAGRTTGIKFLRIASLADRHLLLQSSLCTPENYSGRVTVRSGFSHPSALPDLWRAPHVSCIATPFGPAWLMEKKTASGVSIALVATARVSTASGDSGALKVVRSTSGMDDVMAFEVEAGKAVRIDWLEICYTSRDVARPAHAALAHLERVVEEGVTLSIKRHIATWARHWRAGDVEIDGDTDAQAAIRFACYHLISAANPEDEHASIGARALSGPAYKGHVFWDTEIFLLPFYTLTDPASARALLMYRFHTLDAGRRKARSHGCRGALYAWESADTGDEVTPSHVITPLGDVAQVVTGTQGIHISADIAYAVWQYWLATRDEEFLCNAGAEMLLETARFYASRATLGPEGFYHLLAVVGPDEYHEGVDDNAYTNWMAQWNLECAASIADLMQKRWPAQWQRIAERIGLESGEPARWRVVARAMHTGIDAQRGLIEQFRGYFDLEEIDLAQFAPRSLPIDIVLGRERTQHAKVIKQADVVMLLCLLWNRVPAVMRESSFRYYEPRTEHGSSLSPAMHALLAARLGDMETALRYFRQTREIDLADNMGNAAGGVHIAALGGMWQAVVHGFAGLSLDESGLRFDPHCPGSWRGVRFPLVWRGQKLAVRMEPDSFSVHLVDGFSVDVSVGGESEIRLDAGWISTWRCNQGSWKEASRDFG
jgi:trehalose/maltose hydrolase-like predicted phosphorylase